MRPHVNHGLAREIGQARTLHPPQIRWARVARARRLPAAAPRPRAWKCHTRAGWVGVLSEDDARRHGHLALVRGREPAQHVEPEAGDVELIPLLERAALGTRLLAGLTV